MHIVIPANRAGRALPGYRLALGAALAGTLAACSDSTAVGDRAFELQFDFDNGFQGWVADFADYPLGKEVEWAIGASLESLPAPLPASRRAVRLTGTNHSDDLFLYLTREIAGLEPDASYALRYRVEVATDAPKGCVGVGGAPGESVVLKVGAAARQPARAVDEQEHWRTNFDHGQQLASGRDARSLGNLATENTNCLAPRYELKQFDSGTLPLVYSTNADGRLWLLLGVESGFEGTTTVYVTSVRVDIEKT